MPLPTFVIVGAPKAGTTALINALRKHPAVALPKRRAKELNFFTARGPAVAEGIVKPGQNLNFTWSRGLAWYARQFPTRAEARAIGEASTVYFAASDTPELLRTHLPGARIIVMLRHPVRRLYSHAQQDIKDGRIPALPFAELRREQPQAVRYYEYVSHYQRHLCAFQHAFPRDQLLVLLLDDLRSVPDETLRLVQEFIGVRPLRLDLSSEQNPHTEPRNRRVAQLLNRLKHAPLKNVLPSSVRYVGRRGVAALRRVNSVPTPNPKPPAELRALYDGTFEEDIAYVERLLRRDLSTWRSL